MRVLSSCLASVLLLGALSAPAAAATSSVRLDVGLEPGADPAAVVALLGDLALASAPITGLDAITVDVPADQLGAAQTKLGTKVRYAERDWGVHADGDPWDQLNDTYLRNNQIPAAHTWSTGSPSITVAVVDTGVTPNDDLGADHLVPGYDFVGDDTDTTDDDLHGTTLANVIAAQPGNGVGGTGVCPQCRIMPVRVLRHSPVANQPATGDTADLAAGIVWAADHGAQVVDVSSSTSVPAAVLKDAVDHATAKGALVVASAGHDATPTAMAYPAAYESVVAVGSAMTGIPDNQTHLNTGSNQWIDVAAMDRVVVLGPDNKYRATWGTSYSTAVTSGAAALALAVRPDLTAAQVKQRIVADATHPSNRPPYEAPILDAARMLYHLGETDTQAPVVTDAGLGDTWVSIERPVTLLPKITDDHGIERTDVLLDGKLNHVRYPWVGSTQITPPAGMNGVHQVTLRAYDYAGNVGELTTTINVDTVKPVITWVSPAAEAYLRQPAPITVTVPGGDSITGVALNFGSVALTHVAGTDRWTGTITRPGDGAIEISAVATDRAGNTGTADRWINVDNTGPVASAMVPGGNVHVGHKFTASINGVFDPVGTAYAQLWANGVYVGKDTAAPYSFVVNTGTRNGAYQLKWVLVDKLGNSRTFLRNLIADNTLPAVAFAKAPANGARIGTTAVTASASDYSGIAAVDLIINGTLVGRDTTPAYAWTVYPTRFARTMKVQLRAYDKVGNIRYTSTRIWYRK